MSIKSTEAPAKGLVGPDTVVLGGVKGLESEIYFYKYEMREENQDGTPHNATALAGHSFR